MLAETPGLLTCNQNHNRQQLRDWGYKWQSYQAWNSGRRYPLDTDGDYDLHADRAYGISPGVWGVIYEVEEFYSAAKGAAERAVELSADHLILDVEFVYKNTAPDGGKPIIQGVRDGGWGKEVHLTTLGAPSANPAGGFWDYAMDVASFLETGGAILPQAYWSQFPTADGRSPDYDASACVGYWCDQIGVPRESVNLMIWPNGFNEGSVEAEHLAGGGLGPQMSIFLTESTSAADFQVLTEFSLATAPPPSNGGDNEIMEQMAEMADNIREEQKQMTGTDPEKWLKDNPGEAQELARLIAYAVHKKPYTPKQLKSHAGRAGSGVAQNGVTSMQL